MIYSQAADSTKPNLKDGYTFLINALTDYLDADYGSIFLHEGGILKRCYSTLPAELQIEPRSEGYSRQAINTDEVRMHSFSSLLHAHPLHVKHGIRSIFMIPIQVNNSKGIINILCKEEKENNSSLLKNLQLLSVLSSYLLEKEELNDILIKNIENHYLFFSLASHELKNPLTVVKTYAHMIENAVKFGKIPDPIFVRNLNRNVLSLESLINLYLDSENAHLAVLKYNFEKADTVSLVKSLTDDFTFNSQSIKVDFKCSIDKAYVLGDKEKLQEAFSNILHNALKYSNFNSRILVRISMNKNYYKFIFKDYGIGIPEKDSSYIFEKYYRGTDSIYREGKGTTIIISLPKYSYVSRRRARTTRSI